MDTNTLSNLSYVKFLKYGTRKKESIELLLVLTLPTNVVVLCFCLFNRYLVVKELLLRMRS